MGSDDSTNSGPRVTWRHLTAAASIIAIASLAALVIVGSVNDTDALATIALALAIITFITQIVVFIAQTWTTTQLNAETRGFLEELRTSAHGTEKALNSQVDKLTDHLLRTVGTLRKDEEGGPADLRRRVREDVVEVLEATRNDPAAPVTDWTEKAVSEEDRRILRELATFPEEDVGRGHLALLKELSPVTVANLRRLAEDERQSREVGIEPGVPLFKDHPFSSEARDVGLVEFLPDDHHPDRARLTEKGRQAARLLVARQDIPSWLIES